MTDLEDDDGPKKTPRATIIRRALVVLLVLACAGTWIYTRYLVKKNTLGEACSYDIHCRTEAPRCLKPSAEGEGVCSRSCDTDADCATGIKCIKVELEDRDERGRPLEGGYCFPQALLDARKKKKGDGGTTAPAHADSWLDVPEVPGQLEADVTVERGGTSHVYQVKGTLLRTRGKRGLTIVDTSTLRVYTVDEDKKTFAVSQLGATPGDVTLTKTDRKDKVADRDCEIWQVDDAAGKGTPRETCVIKGASFIDPTAHAISPLDKELAVRGVFALRIALATGDKPSHTVTKLEVHPLESSLFTIPKTFKNLAAR